MLNEGEIFKIVLNNGFMALFVVWVLFRGEPRYRELIGQMVETHKSTISKLNDDHKTVVETICSSHEKTISELQAQCRHERQELQTLLVRLLSEKRGLNKKPDQPEKPA